MRVALILCLVLAVSGVEAKSRALSVTAVVLPRPVAPAVTVSDGVKSVYY